VYNRHRNLTLTVNIHLIYLFGPLQDNIILLHEELAVHPKLFRGPLVDRDQRLAQG
jgi:hypothetical protein